MGQIRIIVDLPGDTLLKAVRREPYPGYDGGKLKAALEAHLKSEFPDAGAIKVEIIANNIFFGVDVMGEVAEEVADAQARLAAVVKRVVAELRS